jgi:putative transposase
MPNHVHLLIRPQELSISRIMQSLLVSHTQRYHRRHQSGGHVWQGRFKSPVIQDDAHLLTVLRYIEANPIRAGIVEKAEEYPWSSFLGHGSGGPNSLLDPLPEYDALGDTPARRRRRWTSFVQKTPSDTELAALRRSVQSGLPYGDPTWVEELGSHLGIDLTIRPRGRPRKSSEPAPSPRARSIKAKKSQGQVKTRS